ncbi:MAG: co-chaperone GroES [Candidatus Kerfeldbacteria bacterium]|nr:co-chaperone GroES [Candidatus Kerfeldbacteria bacterium]
MKLKPLGDHLVVKVTKEDKTTKSGIVLPDTIDKEKQEVGEVMAVGPGKTLDNGQKEEMTVKPGDKILFKKYALDEFKLDEEEFGTLQLSDVIAIVE